MSQGKTEIAGVDDAEEHLMTDVSSSFCIQIFVADKNIRLVDDGYNNWNNLSMELLYGYGGKRLLFLARIRIYVD